MTGLMILIGLLMALLLLFWAAGRGRADFGADRAEEESPVRLPPKALLGRCLSIEDVEYAAQLGSPRILRLLLRERRRLALKWLRQTRQEAGRLLRQHVRAARHAADLRPAAEVRLWFHAGLFLIVYEVLMTAVRLYGPFRTRAFVRSVFAMAGVLVNLGDRIAGTITAGRGRAVREAEGT